MVTPRRLIWPAIGLALTLALTVALIARWGATGDPPNSPQTLPDGTVLTLVQVDYGKTNTLWVGSRFEKAFRRFIPSRGIHLLWFNLNPPVALSSVTNSTDTLVFWIRHSGTKIWKPSEFRQTAITFDETGNYYEVRAGWPYISIGTNNFSVWQIPAFPRSGKTVGLQIMVDAPQNRRQPVAEFVARNPAPSTHTVWNPPALPITNRLGNADFVLTDLTIGFSGRRGIVDLDLPTHDYAIESKLAARATFVVFENGHPSTDWQAALAPGGISDVNGNQTSPLFPRPAERSFPSPELSIVWNFPLGVDEPWKIPVQFNGLKRIPQKVVLNLRGLLVPNLSQPPTIWSSNIFGAELKITVTSTKVFIDLPGEHKVMMNARAMNDSGESLSASPRRTGTFFSYQPSPLEIPKNSKRVDVTVDVFRIPVVEFIAKPRWVEGTNNPPKHARMSPLTRK